MGLFRPWRILLVATLFLVAIFVGASAGLLAGYFRTAPSLDEITFNPDLTTYVYDVHGREIARLHRGENRIPVPLDEIPQSLRQAVIAIEDHRFYEHHGIDFRGFARAIFENLRQGRWGDGNWAQGGGTITGQLARNAFLTLDRTVARKLREWLWAVQIERKYTKDEIFETYLNEIYFGHSAYGVEAAARTYFGKSVRELDLAESALLAGVLNGPGFFSPFYNMESAYNRRALVLDRMASLGYITAAQAQAAKEQEIVVVEQQPPSRRAPYFIDYILQNYLIPRFGQQAVYAGGLRVYTTLDLDAQTSAERALISLLPAGRANGSGVHQPQGAIVGLDPATGHIRIMVGGRGEDHFNRASQAVRQTGSAFKPFMYAAALEERALTPATIIRDEPFEIAMPTGELYAPRNFSGNFLGDMTVREALERSINVVAVRALWEHVPGRMNTVFHFARRLGISTLVESGRLNDLAPSAMALGGLTRGVSPLEMAAAYGTFANYGIYVEPVGVLRVEAHDGTVLDRPQASRHVAMSEETAYLMTDLLRGVIDADHGTARSARVLGRPAAGKTGTTQNNTDAWFVGYTPDLVASVWIGNDQPQSLGFGSARAVQVWTEVMTHALAGVPASWFEPPSGITSPRRIDMRTGLHVPDGCTAVPPGETRMEIFMSGTEPISVSDRCFPAAPVPQMPNEANGNGFGSNSSFLEGFGFRVPLP